VTFNGSLSSDDLEIFTYVWNITELSIVNSSDTPVWEYTFDTPGVYHVELRVMDSGSHWSAPDQVVVTALDPTPPTAVAGPDQSVEVGDTVHFTGAGSSDNIAVTNYTWTIPGGAKMYGATPTHTFFTAGTYTVVLNVSDASGNHGEDSMVVTVTAPTDTTTPTANAGSDKSSEVGDVVSFDGSQSMDDDQIANYSWSFVYDGHTVTIYGAKPTFKFEISGQYTVTLTVKDRANNTDTDTVTVTVSEKPSGAGASVAMYAGAGAAVVFVILAALYFAMRKKKGGSALEKEPVAEGSEEEVEFDPGPPEDGQL
jgi:PKD repeat protein